MSKIYIVKPLSETNAVRLIEAKSKVEVAAIVLADFAIGRADTGEAYRLAASGVKLETVPDKAAI